jgi:hypothetical protein
MQSTSAVGLVLYVLTMTFASIDWGMSLEPHWFSTMYGFLFVIGQALMGLAVAIVVARRLSTEPPMSGVYNAGHFHDFGKLLFAFTMVWAYLSFSLVPAPAEPRLGVPRDRAGGVPFRRAVYRPAVPPDEAEFDGAGSHGPVADRRAVP